MARQRSETNSNTSLTHRFLDEAGDTTFYGKGRASIVGKPGVSLSFAIGMVKFNADLNGIRKAVRALQDEVTADKYLLGIASVAKKAAAGGFYFHATDDPPEVRERFFKFIENLNCTCEVMVARKLPSMFALKHHHQEAEFYADVLSHLLKNKLKLERKVVLNIAERGGEYTKRKSSTCVAKSSRALRENEERRRDFLFSCFQRPESSNGAAVEYRGLPLLVCAAHLRERRNTLLRFYGRQDQARCRSL